MTEPIENGFRDGSGSTQRNEAGPPHHVTVMQGATSLLGEIDEALGMRAPPKKLLLSLLERAGGVIRVLQGKAVLQAAKKMSEAA